MDKSNPKLVEGSKCIENTMKECPVCMCEYSQNDHRLKLLMCSHQICMGCVKEIDKCPICKQRLNVGDFTDGDIVARIGFNCSTCKTRRLSDKMRICITCSENTGVLVTPENLRECANCIFCSDCIIDEHLDRGHRQEKLIEYDEDYQSIKTMQKTCISMKPVLERLQEGLDDRGVKYQRLLKCIDIVLGPEVDIHFTKLPPLCDIFDGCLTTINEDSDVLRKIVGKFTSLEAYLTANSVKLLQDESTVGTDKNSLQRKIEQLKETVRQQKIIIEEMRGKQILTPFEVSDFFVQRLQHNIDTNPKKHAGEQFLNSVNSYLSAALSSTGLLDYSGSHWIVGPSYADRICFTVSQPVSLVAVDVYGATENVYGVEGRLSVYACDGEMHSTKYLIWKCKQDVVRLEPPLQGRLSVYACDGEMHSTKYLIWKCKQDVVRLEPPLQLIRNKKYTVELIVNKRTSMHYGKNGESTFMSSEQIDHPGCKVTFIDDTSENKMIRGYLTNTKQGQFPGFHFEILLK